MRAHLPPSRSMSLFFVGPLATGRTIPTPTARPNAGGDDRTDPVGDDGPDIRRRRTRRRPRRPIRHRRRRIGPTTSEAAQVRRRSTQHAARPSTSTSGSTSSTSTGSTSTAGLTTSTGFDRYHQQRRVDLVDDTGSTSTSTSGSTSTARPRPARRLRGSFDLRPPTSGRLGTQLGFHQLGMSSGFDVGQFGIQFGIVLHQAVRAVRPRAVSSGLRGSSGLLDVLRPATSWRRLSFAGAACAWWPSAGLSRRGRC